ncbi:MAG: ATP-binding protein [Myxococcota bacterium]
MIDQLTRLLPPPLRDSSNIDQYRRSLLILITLITAAVWGPILMVALLFLGAWAAAVGNLVVTAMQYCGFFVFWKTASNRWTAHWIAFWIMGTTLTVSALMGGTSAPALPWVIIVPVLVGYTAGPRDGLFWGGAACAGILALHVAEMVYGDLPQINSEQMINQYRFIDLLALTSCAVLFILFDEHFTTKTLVHLKQANTDLAVARDQAEQAAQFERRFLANMSHEIRTPIHGIVGLCDLMDVQDASQRAYLDGIRSCSDALISVIDGILDLAQLEARRLQLQIEDVEVDELIGDVLGIVSSTAGRKGLSLVSVVTPDAPRAVRADRARLRQVLLNLMGNAIKFTERGDVTLSVSLGEEGRALFTVRDTGLGIPEESQPHLFEPFTRVERTGKPGTGLGLSISAQLLEAMGASLNLNSRLGVGSTFYFTLPTAAVALQQPFQGKRALVVVPSSKQRVALHHMLIRLGAHVQCHAVLPSTLPPFDVALVDAQELQHPMELDPRVLPLIAPSSQTPFRPAGALRMPLSSAQVLAYFTQPHASTTKTHSASYYKTPSVGLKVLVVDDDALCRNVIGRLLERLGCAWQAASDGEQALNLVREHVFDLVLMDYRMPVLDGVSTIKRIRALDGAPAEVPIIATTGAALPDERSECVAAGANDILLKPVRKAALARVVAHYAETASAV